MADKTIVGQLNNGPDIEERDAIHIAVAPVTAAERLYPGQCIGLADYDPRRATAYAKPIGIVDPFLFHPVQEGEDFWMFLFPNTITSLKHVWEHPSFNAAHEVVLATDEAKRAASEEWLRKFIALANCPDYDTVIENALGQGHHGQWDDDYLHFNDMDAHGAIPPEFWDHLEIVSGRKITRRPSYFSCSC